MQLRVLPKEQVPRMVAALMADYRVFGPVAKGPEHGFELLRDPDELRLDYGTTILPPKLALQPPSERIVNIRLADGAPIVEPIIDGGPTVIFGMHTCDLHSLALLDRAFTDDYPDAHYLARRRQTLIVSLECLKPCDEHSFCKDMGTMTLGQAAYDLHLTDIGEDYAVHVGSEAGAAALQRYAQAQPVSDGETQRLEAAMSAKWPRFKNRLTFDAAELPARLAAAYKHPVWKELGELCLACGSCTNVCPTCYCFNVVDVMELNGAMASRTRHWDSCQLEEFAQVAGGESFREARAARQRHRMMRKGKYLHERFDAPGCVGCGRCIRACLVHINIVDTFNAIASCA